MLTVFNDEDAKVALAVRAALPQIAAAVDAIAVRFAQGGRLFYLGAGTSGRLGVLDASECPPTFSVPPTLFVGLIAGGDSALRKSSEKSEDSEAAGAEDLAQHAPTPHDSVIGIAASGRTPYVLGAMRYARELGALTVALTCAGRPNLASGASVSDGPSEPEQVPPTSQIRETGHPESGSPMAQLADIPIELATGAEVLTGSTRLKAGTATKLALNMISTAVMVRGGAVLGNLMVNVQPTNAKLVDRAHRIIVAATGCDHATAAKLLTEAGSVKVAILMQQRHLPYAAAVARLKRLNGNLRQALDATL